MPRIARAHPKHFKPYIDSFDLHLRASGLSDRTREMYVDAVVFFAGWLLGNRPAVGDWSKVDKPELESWFVWLFDQGYAKSTVNNYGRCVQQFFGWYSDEEDTANPFRKIRPPAPPKAGQVKHDIIAGQHLAALIKDAEKGRDYESRRDAALLRLFAATGIRLIEMTRLRLADVSVADRTAVVTGKGDKHRTVKFDYKCAQAVDRYLRVRARHPAADLPALWIGIRRRMPMTRSGIYQVIERRAVGIGIHLHPHMFRHTFSHNWLDRGGAEGDLMELNGWESPQMLRHYGASARGARARRAYDRVDVMGGV